MLKKRLCIVALLLAVVFLLASCNNGDITPNTSENSAHTHTYGEWEIQKAANCTEEGIKERYCSCGEKQTAKIAKTEHNYVDGICACGDNKNENSNLSQTDEIKYNKACSLIEDGKLQEAYEILKEIKNYALANEMLNNFFYAPTLIKEGNLTYISGSNLGPVMQYDDKVYSYDTNGNIISITIPEYNKTYNYTYDSKGNELQGFPIDSPNSYNRARTCSYKNGKLSKISYSDSSKEYFYNSDGSINKIVYTYQSDYYETPIINETIYSYTYYDNNTIKTMRYADDGVYEYQYDTDGDVIKVVIYNDECTEIWGYYSIIYGEFGVEKVEVWKPKYSQTEPVGEIAYNYDTKGLLTEVMCYDAGELTGAYLLSDYTLCYSENYNARDRIDIISYTSIEKIVEFMS